MINSHSLEPFSFVESGYEIDSDGEFFVYHEGRAIKAMFYNDYKKREGISQYKFEKEEEQGKELRLYIKGRKRLNSVVVLDKSLIPEIEDKFISNEEGAFKVKIEEQILEVMFASQYAKKAKVTLQLVNHHLNHRLEQDHKTAIGEVSKLAIVRAESDQIVNLVVCHISEEP